MNKINTRCANIKEATVTAGLCSYFRDRFRESDTAKRLYCAARLKLKAYPFALCIALTDSMDHKKEIFLSSEQSHRPYRLAKILLELSYTEKSDKLLIAVNNFKFCGEKQMDILTRDMNIVSEKLNRKRITLTKLIVSDNSWTSDYLFNNNSYV